MSTEFILNKFDSKTELESHLFAVIPLNRFAKQTNWKWNDFSTLSLCSIYTTLLMLGSKTFPPHKLLIKFNSHLNSNEIKHRSTLYMNKFHVGHLQTTQPGIAKTRSVSSAVNVEKVASIWFRFVQWSHFDGTFWFACARLTKNQ